MNVNFKLQWSLLAVLTCLSFASRAQTPLASPADATTQTRSASKLPDNQVQLPLEFEANRGQAPAQYDFVAHGQSYALGLSPTEIALNLYRLKRQPKTKLTGEDLTLSAQMPPMEHAQVRMRLLGANRTSTASGIDQKGGVSNYFIGNDPTKWRTKVPHYGRVQRAGIYPGIDLIFYGNPDELEYDFRVDPGAEAKTIRLHVSDAVSTVLDRTGDLLIGTGAGMVRLKHPNAYQDFDGVRRPVPSRFHMASKDTLNFEVGAYDRNRPLIIDPVLTYSAAFGGSNGNQALGMDVDSTGNVYVTGNSCSVDFPTTAGNFQNITTPPGLFACQDALVFKLNATGAGLIYSDYFGGVGASTGTHLAIDSAGDAFVTGATTSPNFPLSGNIGPAAPQTCPLLTAPQRCPEAFALKLTPDGSSMAFSTLLGGSQATAGYQAKLNPVTGDLVILGGTNSPDFQPTLTGPQTTYQGGTCYNNTNCLSGFVLGLDPATGALRYGTFLGGTGDSFPAGLGFDASGNIYVAGTTDPPLSSNLGTVTHTYAPSNGVSAGGMDIYMTQLKLSQQKLTPGFITLIQGEGDDIPSGLAVDSQGDTYLIGSTASKNLPVTPGAYQPNTNSQTGECLWTFVYPQVTCGTIFVGKVDPTGALSFLTYLGGSTMEWGEAIALDSLGNLWLTGATASTDFPFTKDAYGLSSFYVTNPFLAEMAGNGQTLTFASPVAGILGRAADLKIDSSNNIYLTGYATDAPTTPGTYSNNPTPLYAPTNPLFVQKWGTGPAPAIGVSAKAVTFAPTDIGARSQPQTVTLSNTGAGPLQLGIQTIITSISSVSNPFLESDNCGISLAANSSCTLTFIFEPVAPTATCTVANSCDPHAQAATVIIETNAPTGKQRIALTGTSGAGPDVSVSPNPITFLAQVAGTASTAQTVLIHNQGDISLVTSSISVGGANAADFQVAQNTSTPCNTPVPSYCTVSLVFSPSTSATGNRTATLNIVDNAADSPQFIPITGSIATPAAALNITPTSVVIYDASIGAARNNLGTIAVTNVSSAASVQVTGITIGGPNTTDFTYGPSISGSKIPFTLTPGQGTTLGFFFMPVSGNPGPRQATVTLTTDPVIPGLPVVQLTSTAVTDNSPTLSFFSNPSPLDLGSVQVGQSSLAGANFLQIDNAGPNPCASGANTCGAPLVIQSIVAGLSDYTLSINSYSSQFSYCTTPPLTIPPGSGCDFTVVFAPTKAGTRNTTLTINSNDPGGIQSVPVTGVGLALPLGNLSVTGLDFGYAAIGIASPALSVTLQNTSAASIAVTSVAASTNYDVVSNTCPATIAPGASCAIGVSFFPTAAGKLSGTLTIADNNVLGGQQVVALTGIAAAGPSIMVRPSAINFGTQTVNTQSSNQAVTVTNFGDTPIPFRASAFRIAPNFVVDSSGCPSTLAIHESCIVNVRFAPFETYPLSGTLSLTDIARGNPQTIFLTGTGSNLTQTALGSSANPSSAGQSITLTASVTGASANSPVPTFDVFSGNVTFYDGTISLGSIAVDGKTGQASLALSSLSKGSHSITAVYGADATYSSSTSAALVQVVSSTTQTASKTTLSSSLNPSIAGQSVTLSATVAGATANSPVPTGSVTFLDGTTMLGSVPLNGSGAAAYSTAALGAGSHSITAVYGSDTTYAASTSPTLTQVVNTPAKVTTATSLISSLNPSTPGQSVTFTATVAGTSSNSPFPTGTVTFFDGTAMLGVGTLGGSGTASFSTATLAVGSHSITAMYGADSHYTASTSPIVTQMVTAPVKVSSTTVLASSANPSAVGESVTFSATVASAGSGTQVATGSISFLDGTNLLASESLDSTGKASFSTSSLTQGSHTITAQYSGDATYLGSTSSALTEAIAAPATFTIGLSPESLTLNAGQTGTSTIRVTSISRFNQAVTFACSGLPQFATCSFSPATLTPAANGSATSTLTIATNVRSALALKTGADNQGGGILAAALGAGILALFRKRLRLRNVKLTLSILLFGVLTTAAISLSGCAGRSSNSTPAGMSSVTITASAGTVKQVETLTLTVR